MNDIDRPSPEEFLKIVQHEEALLQKGQLKIFLGMAAGVGKTYAMLQEAQELQKAEVNVIVGVVETHGRKDTEAWLKGLQQIPLRKVIYKDKEFHEFDVDDVLKITPQAVLVDELAHTNIPGSKNSKRWQDVVELLDKGIDVYTTLNVQHIESLNDFVEGITDIHVKETVPDHVIEKASSIRVVDLTPDELLLRLEQGKVYLKNQSKLAIQNFFQKDKLSALRQLILRYGADKINRDLRTELPSNAHPDWKTSETFLVVLNASPFSEHLIRTTKRFASPMNAPWFAAYVNQGESLSAEESDQLAKNISLAHNLGAEIATLSEPNQLDGIKRLVKQHNITQIVIGNSIRRGFFQRPKSYLLEELTGSCTGVDIHVVTEDHSSLPCQKNSWTSFLKAKWIEYLTVTIAVITITFISQWIAPWIGYKIVGALFLMTILSLSLLVQKGPIFFASILFAFIWNFFFIPPEWSFQITSNEDIALLALYVATAIITGILVDRGKEYKKLLIRSEDTAQILYEISRQIALGKPLDTILASTKEHLDNLLGGDVTIIKKNINNGLEFDGSEPFIHDDKERSIAVWCLDNGKEAGWSTDIFNLAQYFYVPMKGFNGTMGVIAYKPTGNQKLTIEQMNTLYTVSQLLAIHIERLYLEINDIQDVYQLMEKIYQGIINKIAKEIADPTWELEKQLNELKDFYMLELVKSGGFNKIKSMEQTLNDFKGLLNNLGTLEKCIEGLIPIKKAPQRLINLIEHCSNKIERSGLTFKIEIRLKNPALIVSADAHLIELALSDLIKTSIKNVPPDTTITVESYIKQNFVVISISDKGAPLLPHELTLINQKKYTEVNSPRVSFGTVIAEEIAKLHNGYLTFENVIEGGVRVSLLIQNEKG